MELLVSRHLESEMSRSLEREMRIPPREIATERQRELSREAFEMPLFRGEGAVRPGGWGGGPGGGVDSNEPRLLYESYMCSSQYRI